MVDGETGGKHS